MSVDAQEMRYAHWLAAAILNFEFWMKEQAHPYDSPWPGW